MQPAKAKKNSRIGEELQSKGIGRHGEVAKNRASSHEKQAVAKRTQDKHNGGREAASRGQAGTAGT